MGDNRSEGERINIDINILDINTIASKCLEMSKEIT